MATNMPTNILEDSDMGGRKITNKWQIRDFIFLVAWKKQL
jgi:hypothetical protein